MREKADTIMSAAIRSHPFICYTCNAESSTLTECVVLIISSGVSYIRKSLLLEVWFFR